MSYFRLQRPPLAVPVFRSNCCCAAQLRAMPEGYKLYLRKSCGMSQLARLFSVQRLLVFVDDRLLHRQAFGIREGAVSDALIDSLQRLDHTFQLMHRFIGG